MVRPRYDEETRNLSVWRLPGRNLSAGRDATDRGPGGQRELATCQWPHPTTRHLL